MQTWVLAVGAVTRRGPLAYSPASNDALRELLQAKADVQKPLPLGNTPAIAVAQSSHADVLRLLVRAKAAFMNEDDTQSGSADGRGRRLAALRRAAWRCGADKFFTYHEQLLPRG